jgi:hypothetical protein
VFWPVDDYVAAPITERELVQSQIAFLEMLLELRTKQGAP